MNYPGGKNGKGVYQTIINLMPPHEVYIEPFLGSGAILRKKRPAPVNIGMDLDETAVKMVLLAMGFDAAETSGIGGIRSVTPGNAGVDGEIGISDGVGDRFSVPGFTTKNDGRIRPAHSSPTGTAGVGSLTGISPDKRRCSPSFTLVVDDGLKFLESYKFTGRELVYCDPPYMMGARDGVERYKYEMSDVQHRQLLRCCRKVDAMVIISGYWSSLYAKQLAGWHSTHFETMTRGGLATEWVWYNFHQPIELHDYQYLGSDYRERERIKLKVRRWVARLSKMPVLERQALLGALAQAGAGQGPGTVKKTQFLQFA